MRRIKVKVKSTIIGTVIGLVAGAALLCSFAFDSSGNEPERVVEALDGSGMVLAARVDNISGLGDLDPGAGVMSVDELSALGEDDKAQADEAAEGPSEELERFIEALEVDKDYLKNLSKEEIVELSREALESSGKDTALAEGTLVTTGITFEIPEGFESLAGTPGMYVTDRYPIDASNVVYSELGIDYTLQLMDESYFKQLVADKFAEQYEKKVDVNITEFKHMEIDGVPAIRLKAEYDLEDNHMSQLMIVINGSKTYSLVYTQTQDYDRMDAFEESAGSIRVMK